METRLLAAAAKPYIHSFCHSTQSYTSQLSTINIWKREHSHTLRSLIQGEALIKGEKTGRLVGKLRTYFYIKKSVKWQNKNFLVEIGKSWVHVGISPILELQWLVHQMLLHVPLCKKKQQYFGFLWHFQFGCVKINCLPNYKCKYLLTYLSSILLTGSNNQFRN